MNTIILAAGKGKRLCSVEPDVPKPMVSIGGKPVLEHTLEHMNMLGVRRVTITLGHLGDVIMDHFKFKHSGIDIHYAIEKEELGTAGGAKHAALASSDTVLVWYGDNFSTIDLFRMLSYHINTRSDATIAVHWRSGVAASGVYGCLRNAAHRGGTPVPLIRKLPGCSEDEAQRIFA